GGFAGLSGALLAAGAGGVVESLWQVSDQLTPPLMREFHRAYGDSGDPAHALRAAQLAMLAKSDSLQRSPAAWAGFRYTGAERP
ncbi:MAG TPA: CHAT domain-containing protein, partial [Longimicrobium sp.]|nr:CHAT domain-containing protein [Longimicrobium sp.]